MPIFLGCISTFEHPYRWSLPNYIFISNFRYANLCKTKIHNVKPALCLVGDHQFRWITWSRDDHVTSGNERKSYRLGSTPADPDPISLHIFRCYQSHAGVLAIAITSLLVIGAIILLLRIWSMPSQFCSDPSMWRALTNTLSVKITYIIVTLF